MYKIITSPQTLVSKGLGPCKIAKNHAMAFGYIESSIFYAVSKILSLIKTKRQLFLDSRNVEIVKILLEWSPCIGWYFFVNSVLIEVL